MISASRTAHKLRTLVAALLTQGSLYGELIWVEWEEEKSRLLAMVLAMLLGFTFLFCALLFISALILIFSWDTAYRSFAIFGLIGFYTLGAGVAFFRLSALARRSYLAFGDTREELATDIAFIRNKLDQ